MNMANLDKVSGSMLKVLELLEDEPLTDLLVEGFLDYDPALKSRRFHVMLKDIYLEFGHSLLHCASVGWSNLQLEVVDHITCDFDIDKNDEFCVGSLYDLYSRQYYKTSFVAKTRVFIDSATDINSGLLACVAFGYRDGSYIFLNPLNTFGIHVGTEQHLNEWIRANMASGTEMKYEERAWERPFIAGSTHEIVS
jgi:hypothetical protein